MSPPPVSTQLLFSSFVLLRGHAQSFLSWYSVLAVCLGATGVCVVQRQIKILFKNVRTQRGFLSQARCIECARLFFQLVLPIFTRCHAPLDRQLYSFLRSWSQTDTTPHLKTHKQDTRSNAQRTVYNVNCTLHIAQFTRHDVQGHS